MTVAFKSRARYRVPVLVALLAAAAVVIGASVLDERRRLERIARGDAAALRECYELHAGRALGMALRILGNGAEAEEVVQETFLEVWRRATSFDPGRGAAGAWITTIARTRAIDRLRSRDSAARTASAAAAQPSAGDPPSPGVELQAREEQERVVTALRSLPPDERDAIELAYFSGLTHREIAERTRQPLGTVKTRIRRGLERLRQLVSEEAQPAP